ncbi:MAG: Smr/MutS family protein [Phaeodactylibacter sp.]|uniref:Smr/MutS family protein n=1 Tax=Phaeodactylibacter sp. TaxID=1940289 RepID=UPI0032EDC506
MLISVGTRVRLVHLREDGVVTELLHGEGMAKVRLDDGDEIPVFLEDLARPEPAPSTQPGIKAKFVPGKQEKKTIPPKRPEIESQYLIIKSKGIQVAFDPLPEPDGQVRQYNIYLLNDTRNDYLFTFELQLDGRVVQRENQKMDRTSFVPVGQLHFDQLNDAPSVAVSCWRLTTSGTGPKMEKHLRIRPKQFFKRTKTAPLLNRKVHLFLIFEPDADQQNDKKEAEDLRDYTRKNTRPKPEWQDIRTRMPHEVLEMAEFIPEIDLHIEQLSSNFKKMNNAEILRIQLFHFDQYLRKAIRLGVERVFIIHGIGKGKLRDAIASRLIQMPEVRSFRNEYHHRYGYGATEVIF